MKRIRLELARGRDFPEGSVGHGYEFTLPLAADGRVDLDALPDALQLCTVAHFRSGHETEHGQMVALPGGGWGFSYEPGEADDEPIFRLADHAFRQGEYVSVAGNDGVSRTYRVAAVDDLHPPPDA